MCLRNNYDFGILNGEQYYVLDVQDRGDHWLLTIEASGTDDQLVVPAAKQTFVNEDDQPMGNKLGIFTWGYATTGHKAQGSQWPRVLILGRSGARDPRWLYTAVTRASERVVVIQPPR
jgi:ATP-dependent exoDNAse (exonuclease V) alpha subunit